MNVHDASKQRLKKIFSEFDNIYVSFSGGKDSGVMLNLCIDYIRENKLDKKITVLFIDLEAFYSETINFIYRLINNNLDIVTPHWVCLPMLTTNSVSMYEPYWVFWEKTKQEKWVREMPTYNYVINTDNNIFDFYRHHMTFEDFIVEYANWQSKKGKTACLVGIRSDESLNRWRAVNREDVERYQNLKYSVKINDNCFNFYPIYDWNVEDIWTYNGKYKKDYNHVYDLMYRAGVPLSKQRICEPYGDEQKAGLNMFRIIEPATWYKVVDRVSGANFGAIYCNTKATGIGKIKLPANHTWRSYCKFLLKTLPDETKESYIKKFITFIRYWNKKGSPLNDEMIELIKNEPCVVVTDGFSNRGKGEKFVVRFNSIPDTIVGDNKTDMLSWKRMCMAILKNDITCKSLSFGMTKYHKDIRSKIMNTYKSLSAPEKVIEIEQTKNQVRISE